MLVVLLAFATFVSTMLGGLFALKNQDRLHRILGFTAGVILGVVAFDVLPEIFNIAQEHNFDPTRGMVGLAVGFLAFHALEKFTMLHGAHEEEYQAHRHPRLGLMSALALSGHSFFDGIGIGLAFQINTKVGLAIAIAVIGHDFADGLNTVSLMLVSKNSSKRTMTLLIIDALAPVLGAASTLFFHLSSLSLMVYLGFFAGFLLYIGASDILPEAHSKHPSRITVLLTITGTIFIYLVTRAAL